MAIERKIHYNTNGNDLGFGPERFIEIFGEIPTNIIHVRFGVHIDKLLALEGLELICRTAYAESNVTHGGFLCFQGDHTIIGAGLLANQSGGYTAECSIYTQKGTDPTSWLEKLWDIKADPDDETRPQIRLLTPTFGGELKLTKCDLSAHEIDIDKHYNDDIVPTMEAMESALTDNSRGGLVLLDGLPGTGKTNLVKWLTSKYHTRKFIFIPSGMVESLSGPQLIDLLLDNPGSVLFIEDAERALTSRESSGQSGVVSTLLQLTDGVLGDALQLMVIATCNADISKVDQALLRPGRLIAQYTFGKLSVEKANAIREELNMETSRDEATLAELYANKVVTGGKLVRKQIGFGNHQVSVPKPVY